MTQDKGRTRVDEMFLQRHFKQHFKTILNSHASSQVVSPVHSANCTDLHLAKHDPELKAGNGHTSFLAADTPLCPGRLPHVAF